MHKLTHNIILSRNAVVGLLMFLAIVQMAIPRASTQAFTDNFMGAFANLREVIPVQAGENKEFVNTFPVSKDAPKRKVRIPITAYNSVPWQTDSTPCIAASGYDLCEANEETAVAANFLPLGTKVKIPELFGDREFTVVDRMNARYYYRMDVWMKEVPDARQFGIKYATVEVY